MPSSESGSRDIRRVGLRLLTFMVPLLFGWGVVEWGMAKVPNSASVKRERLHALAGDVDALILGSSETYYGISAHELEGTAFNLANTAQSLYYDFELTQRLLPELPKLSRVYILVSYASLQTELFDHPDSVRIYQYYREWGIPLQRIRDYFDPALFSRVALYTPRTALQALARGFDTTLADHVDDRGWYRVPDENRWGLDDEAALGRLQVHHGFMREQYIAGNLAVLERLLALLREKQIQAVMITMPVWHTYSANLRQESWQRTRAAVERLAREQGAAWFDFHSEPQLVASDFSDASHLSADGAVHFARILNEALGPPSLRQSVPAESGSDR